MMAASDDDRARMQRLAADLQSIESDEEVTGTALAKVVESVNVERREAGRPPLEPESHPEEEFYRRARALGLRRIRG